ncbi:homoserine kinase [Bacillus ectoiniformans]|uniref:homoserine kinase n=1 Tax=Bacillus ectoiniformans TaxID=1494429 RepID=UPI00195BB131|nr:homoserine kinase [Bacillus ectoiniformans]MBM7647755.1 homoserine kinase [Bacillus ectoiniformans]
MSAPDVIKVPASTANLGPGFDSIGLAFNLYLTLEVERAEKWSFEHTSEILQGLPTDESHLVYQVAKKTADLHGGDLPPLKVRMHSDIPLARGLGSSAAAIAAGIELADIYANLGLTNKEKLQIGNSYEGHPDNIGASIYGGMVVGVSFGETAEIVHLPAPDMDLIVTVPRYELKTEEARSALPDSYTRQQAVEASAVSNVLIAALATENYSLAGEMMERDVFHEQYRAHLIKEFEDARVLAKETGAFATVISGAGPTILTFTPKGKAQVIAECLQERFDDCDVLQLEIDSNGVQKKIKNKSFG